MLASVPPAPSEPSPRLLTAPERGNLFPVPGSAAQALFRQICVSRDVRVTEMHGCASTKRREVRPLKPHTHEA